MLRCKGIILISLILNSIQDSPMRRLLAAPQSQAFGTQRERTKSCRVIGRGGSLASSRSGMNRGGFVHMAVGVFCFFNCLAGNDWLVGNGFIRVPGDMDFP